MKTISSKVPDELDLAVEALAVEQGISKSQVVRESLNRAVLRKRKRASRAIELARDLAGIVKGPGDLLANPKYIEDFGA